MARILVTGSSGYIGQHVVRELLAHKHQVLSFDLLTGDDLRDFNHIRRRFASTTDPIHAVIHLAGLSSSAESMRRPDDYWETNVVGTYNLLSAMRQHGCHKIAFASSCAIYGESVQDYVREDTTPAPVSTYGNTKVACENAIKSAGVTHGLQYAILRLFNVAGNEDPNECRLLPSLCRAAMPGNETACDIYARYPTHDGTAIRDYVHVFDVVRAFRLALGFPVPRLVANVGTGIATSSLQLADAFLPVVGRMPAPLVLVDRRRGDPSRCVASREIATRLLDWHPEHGLASIVQSAYSSSVQRISEKIVKLC